MLDLSMHTADLCEANARRIHLSWADLVSLGESQPSTLHTHKSADDRLHETFVVCGPTTYRRPSRFRSHDASVFIVRGEADLVLFDDDGAITQVVRMGDLASTRDTYYCRIPAPVFRTIVVRCDETVLFEATAGPYAATLFADWAPAESDRAGVVEYLAALNRRLLPS